MKINQNTLKLFSVILETSEKDIFERERERESMCRRERER